LNGNQQAQKELYNKYKKSVECFLKKKYFNLNDIEDSVSEIMIKVFMNLNTFDDTKSKFRSWVFSIAKNYMIDKWRNNSYSTTFKTSDISFTSIMDNTLDKASSTFMNNTYSAHNTEFENNNSINYISTQISPQDFKLLNMKYVQGYNYGEIGKEFNVTSSTISNRINYIKSKLKKNKTEIMY